MPETDFTKEATPEGIPEEAVPEQVGPKEDILEQEF